MNGGVNMYWIEAIKNTFKFKGRARRKEYWQFYLLFLLVPLVIVLPFSTLLWGDSEDFSIVFMTFYTLVAIFLNIALMSVTFRRLHDIGKSGWWYWIQCIPLAGLIILIIFVSTDSEKGMNKYGESPKVLI